MDITSMCNNSFNKKNKVERLPKSSYVNSLSKLAVLREKRYQNCDALLAVKLDPAVLDAQVSIENNKCSIANTEKPKAVNKNGNVFINSKYEKAMALQQAALFSLSWEQFNLLMKYVATLRQQRISLQKRMECAFCRNNGHPEAWFTTHTLKDRNGRVKCPILRTLSCKRCGATGDRAHTIKYCPLGGVEYVGHNE